MPEQGPTCYLLPVTCYLLPVTCYLLLVTCYLLPVTCYLLPVTCYPLPVTRYLLPVTCYLLPVTCYPLPVTGSGSDRFRFIPVPVHTSFSNIFGFLNLFRPDFFQILFLLVIFVF